MDFLNIIIQIFEKHEIIQYSELAFNKFNKTKKYQSSEGIKFQTSDFAGEIFYYTYENTEYCEMEVLIFKEEKYKYKISENKNLIELKQEINQFLTETISELKTLPNKV